MIEGKSVIAVIPARGGSKGIKNKNILDICGKPLIAYTIEAARDSEYIDEVVVTTDSEQIATISKEYGANVPFLRPKELAGDHTKTIDVVLHTVLWFERNEKKYDICILLQPTSPLRTNDDINGALEQFVKCNYGSLVAISEVQDSPILIREIDSDNKLKRLLDINSTIRRQDMRKYYRVNGSIYVCMEDELCEQTSFNDFREYYIMEQSHAVDIDDMLDVEIVNYYLNKKEL